MKDEYDFSNGKRGKFHQSKMVLVPPIHSDLAKRSLLDTVSQNKVDDIGFDPPRLNLGLKPADFDCFELRQ